MCLYLGGFVPVCILVITDGVYQIHFDLEKKRKGSDWFLSFANKTDILEDFYLLKVSCHLDAAELNYSLPYRQANTKAASE